MDALATTAPVPQSAPRQAARQAPRDDAQDNPRDRADFGTEVDRETGRRSRRDTGDTRDNRVDQDGKPSRRPQRDHADGTAKTATNQAERENGPAKGAETADPDGTDIRPEETGGDPAFTLGANPAPVAVTADGAEPDTPIQPQAGTAPRTASTPQEAEAAAEQARVQTQTPVATDGTARPETDADGTVRQATPDGVALARGTGPRPDAPATQQPAAGTPAGTGQTAPAPETGSAATPSTGQPTLSQTAAAQNAARAAEKDGEPASTAAADAVDESTERRQTRTANRRLAQNEATAEANRLRAKAELGEPATESDQTPETEVQPRGRALDTAVPGPLIRSAAPGLAPSATLPGGGETTQTNLSSHTPATTARTREDAMPQQAGGTERAVASQIVAAINTRGGTGRISVHLDPPELGRIEISLDVAEQGLKATVISDRPQTADLIRRNADLLMQQFEDAGFTDIDLSFGGRAPQGEGNGSAERNLELLRTSLLDPEADLVTVTEGTATTTDRLDIRL